MVGWSRRSREASERAAAWAAREKACIDGGCKCYCHAPKPEISVKVPLLLLLFTFVVVIFGVMMLVNNQGPREPYVCNGITSTGAPADCHPVVMSPEDLKKYEDQFNK